MNHKSRLLIAAALCSATAFAPVTQHAIAQEPTQIVLPEGGTPIMAMDDITFLETGKGNAGESRMVQVDGPGFKNAIHAEVTKRGNSWDLEARVQPRARLAKGEAVLVRFYARTLQTRNESGQGLLSVSLGETRPPWTGQFSRTFSVGSQWQPFVLRGAVGKNYGKGRLALKFSFGLAPQIMEVGGVEILSYGTAVEAATLPETRATYAGREAKAPWRVEAEQRIRQIRTAPMQVGVIDRSGKALRGATVHIALQKHDFGFGTALNAATLVKDDKPENAIYRQRFLELFNSGSFYNNLKWQAWAGEWGPDLNRDTTLQGLRWLRDHDKEIRGHVLVWPSFHNMPAFMQALEIKPDAAPKTETANDAGPTAAGGADEDDVPELTPAEKAKTAPKVEKPAPPKDTGAKSTASPEELQRLVLARIDDVTAATAPYISEWDVINEPRDNHDLMDIIGQRVLVDYFRRARNRLPNARLALNDYSILSSLTDSISQQQYEDFARYLIENKAPLDVLGFQGHFGASVPSPMYIKTVLDRFAKLGRPMRITEFTIAGDDDELKADFTRDFLTLIYSYPSTIGFQHWGLEQVVNPDGSLSAMGEAYRKLVKEQWNTDVTAQTNARGLTETRGFLGRYNVTVTQGDRTVTVPFDLRRDSQPLIVTLP